MANFFPSEIEQLRAEIAVAAARMIAEDGADYGTAKRKAAKQILGNARIRGDILPDNSQIEDEVRAYNELFFADTQPERLFHLRKLALRVMEDLEEFTPFLTGAVLNGTAGEHSGIHLQLFSDNSKDVVIFLVNRDVNFEVSETTHFRKPNELVETLSFLRMNEEVHLALYSTDDLRGARKTSTPDRPDRADISKVRQLVSQGINEK